MGAHRLITRTRPIVWEVYLTRVIMGQHSRWQPDTPYIADEEHAKIWVQHQVNEMLEQYGELAVLGRAPRHAGEVPITGWDLTGHVIAGYADERNGQPRFEGLLELYNQIYGKVNAEWRWLTIGRHPADR